MRYMNEILAPSFESEIQELEQVLPRQEDLTQDPESHKETIRQAIGEKIQAIAPHVTPQPSQSASATPSYLAPELQEQIQTLVNIAFSQSIDQAIKQVKATHDPALIDAFHDALVTELYDHLVERQKLAKL